MKTLVIAPHADDEILGAGGTLFKEIQKKPFNLLAFNNHAKRTRV